MKPTDFSKRLTDFLICYLPGEKGVSKNTIASYKDTFILFLTFMKDEKGIPANKLLLKQLTKENIVDFLDWIEESRHCCTATRNVRLAALHSFFHYLQYQCPENLLEWQRILSIPVKRTEKTSINYLSLEGIRLLLEEPDRLTRNGRRDLALLSLMYDSGARVQEIIDLTPSMVRFDVPCTIKLIGKGNKARIVPLLDAQMKFLKMYMAEQKLLEPYANMYPLFSNSRKEKLTRAGVNYILAKYAMQARTKNPSMIPEKLSCHTLRHSKAMHLLQSGVNLVYIRDILGHTSIQVTEVYARTDSRQKRAAIEKAYTDVTPEATPIWLANDDLLEWLKSFSK
ncbi:site-specific recombinase XerD [Desulfosporosinus acidiphilus SJ4]|uniref:Site-specific recombinase XerD n=1 Tax=Desulfosporosinus acidiphilus (strain DSM 22704 / JCM 16185 / SJ4) TaxID=646529 RepID=I4D6V7_DESAJ|nr:site-specific integrase [Desulfosporosinus acidiphilus]AFM41531.1 site-specific recombinase XerD [Desulfosporosinus acidiphilus SJ4]